MPRIFNVGGFIWRRLGDVSLIQWIYALFGTATVTTAVLGIWDYFRSNPLLNQATIVAGFVAFSLAAIAVVIRIYDQIAGPRRSLPKKEIAVEPEPPLKTLGQSLSMPMGPQEFVTSLVNASAPADQQLRLPTTREKRDAAISLGGLIGAKALIEDLIDAIPTNPPDLVRGAWGHWLQRADSQLSSLLKTKNKNEIMKRLRSIDLAKYLQPSSLAGPRNEALPYLRGIINNLTEDDRRKDQPTS